MVVPAATPKFHITRRYAETVVLLNQIDVGSPLEAQARHAWAARPQFARFMREEIARCGAAVKLSCAKPE